MTQDQIKAVAKLLLCPETCTLLDLREAVGSKEVELCNVAEASVFVSVYRMAKGNKESNDQDDLEVVISENLAKDMNKIAEFAAGRVSGPGNISSKDAPGLGQYEE
jgi:hypothetical protein